MILAFLFLPFFAWATDYYVATNGNDSTGFPGDINHPFATVQYVIDTYTLVGGDRVILHGGTYTEQVRIGARNSGSGGNYITLMNYANEDVIMNGVGFQHGVEAVLEIGWGSGSNVTSYIKVDGSGNDNGYHLIFDGSGNNKRGIETRNVDHAWIKNVEAKNFTGTANGEIGIKMTSLMPDMAGGGGTDPGAGVDGTRNSLVENCLLHNNDQYAIKVSGWNTSNNVIRIISSILRHIIMGATYQDLVMKLIRQQEMNSMRMKFMATTEQMAEG